MPLTIVRYGLPSYGTLELLAFQSQISIDYAIIQYTEVIKMKYYIEYARKVFLCLSAIIVGIFIFLSSSTAHINYNILSPTFHEKLFVKHDIYSGATYLLENSITKFIAYVKEVSPDSYTQQKDVFDVLEQTTSKEAVTRSIDFLREGIYEYMSGQRHLKLQLTILLPRHRAITASPTFRKLILELS